MPLFDKRGLGSPLGPRTAQARGDLRDLPTGQAPQGVTEACHRPASYPLPTPLGERMLQTRRGRWSPASWETRRRRGALLSKESPLHRGQAHANVQSQRETAPATPERLYMDRQQV